MVVDFEWKKAKGFRAIVTGWKGPWNERKIRGEFERLAKWAAAHGLKTGQWVFLEPATRQWLVGIEVQGRVKTDGTVRTRTFAAASVAQVTFDPDVVSPRVVYHGVNDWLRWKKKDKTIKSIGTYREVYTANPWTEPKAWKRTTIQVTVRK
jgi:hypothetical protein